MTYTEGIETAVQSAALAVWSRYRRYVDRDDVTQQLWLWVAGHQDTIERLLGLPDWMMQRRLRTVAERWCRAEKAARAGYEPQDEYFYSRKQLARLIFDAFDDGATPPSEGFRDDELYSEWAAEIADVRRALGRVPLASYALLKAVAAGETPEDAQEVRHALWHLQKALGGSRGV